MFRHIDGEGKLNCFISKWSDFKIKIDKQRKESMKNEGGGVRKVVGEG